MYEITIHNINGQSTVSSVQVANDFRKRHDHVIRDIESLIDIRNGAEKTIYIAVLWQCLEQR